MSEPDPTPELKATKTVNESALPEDVGREANSEKRGEKGNSMRTVGIEEGKDELIDDALGMAEAEGSKLLEMEDSEMAKTEKLTMTRAENLKMLEAEGQKDEKGGKADGAEEECKKMEEDNDLREERNGTCMEKKVEEHKGAKGLRKKWARRLKIGEKGESKEKKEDGLKAKHLLSTPGTSSIARPVRERKIVERLLEALEKEPVKTLLIEKGRGTPLKDIPNVAHKLAKKKSADLRLLHKTLYGRIGKAVDYKNHILQFSGFVWHDDEEKQKTKVKEKLDKCIKDTLVDLCDLFDLPVSKAASRKEELVAMVLDFMMAPHATTDFIIPEKEQQSTKCRKRKRVAKGSASDRLEGQPMKRSRKKRSKSEITPKAKRKSMHEIEEDDKEHSLPYEHNSRKHSESKKKENGSDEAAEEDENADEDLRKGKLDKSSKRIGPISTKKSKAVKSSPKAPRPTTTESPTKKSSSKHSKAEESKNIDSKVFSPKKKNVDLPGQKSTIKPDHKEKGTEIKIDGVKPDAPALRTIEEEADSPSDTSILHVTTTVEVTACNILTFDHIVEPENRLQSLYNEFDITMRATFKQLSEETSHRKVALQKASEENAKLSKELSFKDFKISAFQDEIVRLNEKLKVETKKASDREKDAASKDFQISAFKDEIACLNEKLKVETEKAFERGKDATWSEMSAIFASKASSSTPPSSSKI